MSLLQLLGVFLLALPLAAQPFQPRYVLPGTVRIWGNPAMLSVVLAWEDRFHLYHPEVQFTNQLLGSDTAMGALYGGVADLALLGREPNQTERDGFLHSLGYDPIQLRLVNGSLETQGKSPAPVLLVSVRNPLHHLSMEAVRRALGQPATGSAARTWGDLGATGEWAARPLHVYTVDLETGTGLFLLNAVQGASKKMNWPAIREFHDVERNDGSVSYAAAQTAEALLNDPDGLAVSTLQYASAAARPLALGEPAVSASNATVIEGSYPLARRTYAFLNRRPGEPTPQPVTEFLRFVLSEEAQELVRLQSGFLPLSTTDAAAQQRILTHP